MDAPRTFDRTDSDLSRFIRAIRDHWLIIVVIVAVSLVTAGLLTYTVPKRYEATADLLVNPVSNSDTTFIGIDVLRESSDQSRSVLTVARILQSPGLEASVRSRLGSEYAGTDLTGALSVSPLGQSAIVAITATASTPRGAAAIANGFANELVASRTASFQRDVAAQIKRLKVNLAAIPESQRASGEAVAIQQRQADLSVLVGAADPTVKILDPAVPPTSPSWPRPKLILAITLIASLLLGSMFALALEFFNPGIRRDEDLLLEHRLPVLARVPQLSSRVVHGYLSGREPLPSSAWEAYRQLRASLTGTGEGLGLPGSILVTSAAPGEGKTMTSVNLALTLASSGSKVVLVDGDLRHPMIASIFGVAPGRNGLATTLLDMSPPEEVLIEAPGNANLRLLLARPENAEYVDLLVPARITGLVNSLRTVADVVIFDSPPVGEAADALGIAAACEVVLLAVRRGTTRRERLADLQRVLAQRGIPITGVVLTTDRRQSTSHYYNSDHASQPGLRGPGTGATTRRGRRAKSGTATGT